MITMCPRGGLHQKTHGSSSLLAATGGGYGLQGVRERVQLLGGRCMAGPTEDGWQVQVEVA
jgi:signal transduction histidine kinase